MSRPSRPSVLPLAAASNLLALQSPRPSPLRQSTTSPPHSPVSPTDSEATMVSLDMSEDSDDETQPMLPPKSTSPPPPTASDASMRVWIPDTPAPSDADKYGSAPLMGKSFFKNKLIASPQLMLYSPALDGEKPELGPTPYRSKAASGPSWGFLAGFALAACLCFATLALALFGIARGFISFSMPDNGTSSAGALKLVYDNPALPLPVRAHALRESVHLAPKNTLEYVRLIEPLDTHELTIIGLHGLGGNVQYHPFPGGLDETLPGAKFVIPQGPMRHVTWNGQELPGWFDIRHLDDLYMDEDIDGLMESARQIHHLIEQERQVLIDAGKEPRIAISGFSQGAVMSMLVGLTTKHEIEGVAPLSGYLALKKYHTLLGELASPGQSWFVAHGDEDAVLPVWMDRAAVELFQSDAFGMEDVEYHEYKGQVHDWTPLEMGELNKWAEEKLGSD